MWPLASNLPEIRTLRGDFHLQLQTAWLRLTAGRYYQKTLA